MLNGWGKRGYNLEYTVAAQHQLADRVSVNGGYYRREFGNQTFTDDLRYDASSYDYFCINAPADPDLPRRRRLSGVRRPGSEAAVFALNLPANSLIRFSDDFGGETNMYQGFDINLEGRFRNGAFLKGGIARDVAHLRQLQSARSGSRKPRRSALTSAQGTEIYRDGTNVVIASIRIRPDGSSPATIRCRGVSRWPARISTAAVSRLVALARASWPAAP